MDTAWNTYPRPQMRRASYFSLNGTWELAVSSERCVPNAFPFRIRVPFPPESEGADTLARRKKNELLYYRRTFCLPENFVQKRTLLHFGAVDQIATVILNGSPLLTHEGGYLPFSLDVSEHLQQENELIVAVSDTLDHTYPYGKQKERRGGMWYTPVSGIWQSVWMESYPEGGIYDIRVSADDRSVHISVDSDAPSLTLRYTDGETKKVLSFQKEITLTPKSRRLWSPEFPNLYPFTVESETDCAESYFAMRRLESKKCGAHTRFFLNGSPYFLHGVLDQGYYPYGIYLPESENGYREDILRIKRLGFNLVRKHIKVEPALFYYFCDREGLIVCQDAVNNGSYSFLFHTALPTVGMKRFPHLLLRKSKRAREFFRKHTAEMLAYVTRFPSVLLFTIFNEAWGQKDAATLYRTYKEAYPSLLFDTASGWFHTKWTDMRSDHVYFKRIKPNYKKEEKPVFLSEFGGYSLPLSGHVFTEGKSYGYTTCQDGDELLLRLCKLYREQVIPAIEAGLSGAVITQITDVEDETNGFYTYDREIEKIPAEAFAVLRTEIDQAMQECTKEN